MFKLHQISEIKEALINAGGKKTVLPKQAKDPLSVPSATKRMVVLDKKCTACGACKIVCPAHAITVEENKRYRIVDVNLVHCIYCGLCVEACPEKALAIVSENELPSLHKSHLHHELRIKLTRCERCPEMLGTTKSLLKTVKDIFSESGITTQQLEWVHLCPACRRKLQSHSIINQKIRVAP